MSNGLNVVSSARKVIFAIPNTDRVASFPEGAPISEYGQNNDRPAIVVCNYSDPSHPWQGADGTEGVIIMNEVPEQIAEELLSMLQELGHDWAYNQPGVHETLARHPVLSAPYERTEDWINSAPYQIEHLDLVVARAHELGVRDIYTTNKSFVDNKLSPAGRMLNQHTGIVKRSDRDVCTVYRDAEGVLLINVPGGDGARRIEEDILLRTYRRADGSDISLDEIPVIA